MKSVIKLFLAIMMMCSLVTPNQVFANETHKEFSVVEEPKVYLSSTSTSPKASSPYSYANEDQLLQIIIDKSREALLSGSNLVDLKPYKMNKYTTTIGSGYNYFIPYVCDGITIRMYVDSQGYYTHFSFDNPKTIKETKNHIRKIDEELAILKTVVSTNYSDEKNALILHDYLVDAYSYDETLNYEKSAYVGGVLLNKEAICQTYSYIYKYILSTVGIKSYYITSEELNHAWNIVDIDGTYYHVDVTWDDPITDRKGGVNHKNFLLSDNGIYGTGHKGWENKGFVCTSTKYDNYFWKNVQSHIVIVGNDYYYAVNRQFVRADSKGNIKKVIRQLGKWPTGEGTYWVDTYSGAFKNGNYVYYNTPDTICRYNISTGVDEACYRVDDSRSILGIRNRNNVVQVFLGYQPYNGTGQLYNTYHELIDERAKISGVNVTKNEYVMNIGEEALFYVTAYPMHSSYSQISWKVADSTIAAFSNSTGNVIAKKAGKTTITITSDNGVKKVVNVRVRKALPFKDVPKTAWYRESVEEAYDLGLMTGATDTLFKPTVSMNRGMVAIVLHRMEGSKKVAYSKVFPDVPNNQYYTTSVLWAKQTGIITGYNNGKFMPLKNVTREEMATMIQRFAKYKGLDVTSSKDITYFKDYANISTYAKQPIQWCVENGVLSGKFEGTKVDPLGTASRAECAKMLVQAYKVIYK